jgi:hypothetical protein
VPSEEERIELLTSSIDRSLKLLGDFSLLKDFMGDERYSAAIHTLRSALRREKCFTLPAGAELEMRQAVCVARADGGSRVVPLKTRLRFTGHFDDRQRMECEAVKVPSHKNDMSAPVVGVGECVFVSPDWCKVA